jgi:nicotinamide-nucleotide amidase
MGGVVSYADAAKVALLSVRQQTIREFGAVSEEVAREMADGIRLRLAVDVGVSITGIAGPGGGTAEKPLGLTYIGLSDGERTRAHRYVWPGDRRANREESVEEALRLLLSWAKEQ